MPSSTDVAIIGGGAVGSAVAYFLLSDPAWKGRVTVLERDPSYKRASSALSASSIRQQFSTPENIRMSRFGFQFLSDVQRHLAVEATVDIGLRRQLSLSRHARARSGAARESAIRRAENAEIAGANRAQRALPVDVGRGISCVARPAGGGWFWPRDLRRKARSRNTRRRGGQRAGGRAHRVEVKPRRRPTRRGMTVNAAARTRGRGMAACRCRWRRGGAACSC
jgi:glycine/D-amino acid oxidase-like deaminating enzyme